MLGHGTTIASLALAALIVGCTPSVTPVLDDARVQEAIRDELSPQLEIAFPTIDCPKDVPIESGRTFTCVATMRPVTGIAEIRVTQTDDRGSLDIRLLTLIADRVEHLIQRELGDQLTTMISTVECGEHRPMLAGNSFECIAEIQEDGRDLTVLVTQTDDNGSVDWTLTSSP